MAEKTIILTLTVKEEDALARLLGGMTVEDYERLPYEIREPLGRINAALNAVR